MWREKFHLTGQIYMCNYSLYSRWPFTNPAPFLLSANINPAHQDPKKAVKKKMDRYVKLQVLGTLLVCRLSFTDNLIPPISAANHHRLSFSASQPHGIQLDLRSANEISKIPARPGRPNPPNTPSYSYHDR